LKRLRAGFTLIEVVIVIVILGIASAVVIKMVAQVANGQSDNQTLQVGAQLLQECGEWIVANHRRDKSFYTSVLVAGTSTNCFSGPGTYGGFDAPSVVVTDITGGTGCPGTSNCKQAVISVSKGGVTLNSINLIVVQYTS
jgi:prepilin-type N-terminal cleavage/methylation domain-containing protein